LASLVPVAANGAIAEAAAGRAGPGRVKNRLPAVLAVAENETAATELASDPHTPTAPERGGVGYGGERLLPTSKGSYLQMVLVSVVFCLHW
jgi:hypothetical protein